MHSSPVSPSSTAAAPCATVAQPSSIGAIDGGHLGAMDHGAQSRAIGTEISPNGADGADLAPHTPIDADELLVHIKGVRFERPELGAKGIANLLSSRGLSGVGAARVRRLMKKHGLLSSQLEEDCARAGVLRLFTVGDADRPHVAKELPQTDAEAQDWVPVELKVPAERSGKRPFQATIALRTAAAEMEAKSRVAGVQGTVYKIQVAVEPEDAPLLMYNSSRSQSTYIHPDAKGYAEMRAMVKENGASGPGGGSKAYFYGKQNREVGRNFVLINITMLAPVQSW